jgi:hypothetical protein
MNGELGLLVSLGLCLTFSVGATKDLLDDLHRGIAGGKSAHEMYVKRYEVKHRICKNIISCSESGKAER